MKHVRTLSLGLVSLCVCAGLFATTASAAKEKLPAWGQCVPTAGSTGGKYGNAGCTALVKPLHGEYLGGYEWYPMEVSPEIDTGESILADRASPEEQPVSSTTLTLADGSAITCEALREETEFEITGPTSTLGAPHLAFQGCRQTAPSEGSLCFSTDAELEQEITTYQEFEDYKHGEGPTWNGKLTYFEGKKTSNPVVGYVWETNPADQHFLQQVVCEGGPVNAMLIGGHKKGEELAMQITPVNTMSASHTLTMTQSGGVQQPTSFEGHRAKPLEAQVNGTTWEPIGFETTMLFPETEPEFSQAERAAGVRVRGEEELKATP